MTLPWTYIVLLVLFSLAGIISNLSFIVTIAKHKVLHTPTNRVLLSLSISDFFVSVIGIPFSVVAEVVYLGHWTCFVVYLTLATSVAVSVFHLVAVSVERFIAIVHPFRYARFVTDSRVRICIVTCWLIPVLIYCFPLTGWQQENFLVISTARGSCNDIFTCTFLCFISSVLITLCLIIFLLYVFIFKAARRQQARVVPRGISDRKTRSTSEMKTAVVILYTIGYLIASIIPGQVATLVSCLNVIVNNEALRTFSCLVFSNSILNPLIYGLGNKEIRPKMLKIVSWKLRKHRVEKNPTVRDIHIDVTDTNIGACDP